jgi:HSP20 family molecular chaperone IbpA
MAWLDRKTAVSQSTAGNAIERLFEAAFSGTDPEAVTMMGWRVAHSDHPYPGCPELGWLDPEHADVLAGVAGTGGQPAVKIQDTPAGLVVVLRLPRLVKDSVTIVVQDNILTVRGEQSLPDMAAVHRDWAESGSRCFTRSISLPRVDGRHRIRASFRRDGVRILIRRPAT